MFGGDEEEVDFHTTDISARSLNIVTEIKSLYQVFNMSFA